MSKTNNVIYLYSDNEDYNDIIELLNIGSSLVYYSSISLEEILSGSFLENNKKININTTLFMIMYNIYEDNSAQLFSIFKKKI